MILLGVLGIVILTILFGWVMTWATRPTSIELMRYQGNELHMARYLINRSLVPRGFFHDPAEPLSLAKASDFGIIHSTQQVLGCPIPKNSTKITIGASWRKMFTRLYHVLSFSRPSNATAYSNASTSLFPADGKSRPKAAAAASDFATH